LQVTEIKMLLLLLLLLQYRPAADFSLQLPSNATMP
jgi:hypothetical protein